MKDSIPLLLLTFFFVHQPEHLISLQATSRSGDASICPSDLLPAEIRNRLKSDFPAWKIQDTNGLAALTRQRWESEKPLQCPGVAIGKFESSESLSFAVLLVPTTNTVAGYRLLVFDLKSANWAYRVVDQSEEGRAGTVFIRAVAVSKFFDEASRRKFHAEMPDCILIVDAAESEYEADIIFLAGGEFRKEPVDY